MATTGPGRGRADVLIDGRLVDTVSLRSAERRSQQVVWAGKLPVGIQLVGRAFTENLMLAVALAFQKETDWHRRVPADYAKEVL